MRQKVQLNKSRGTLTRILRLNKRLNILRLKKKSIANSGTGGQEREARIEYSDKNIIYLTKDVGDVPPCGFILHSTCVAYIMDNFVWSEDECLPACSSYSFHQENIQDLE